MDEIQKMELIEKIAYKNWQIRTREKDERDEDNPLFGYGCAETDFIKAEKIVLTFEKEIEYDKDDVQDYLDLFGDILENYFTKDYLSTYVYSDTNC